MQKIICAAIALMPLLTYAQIPEDAVRYSWITLNGTARNQAIGGAMGSLGGDITSTFVNPAGIAFYKTNEATLSLGYNMAKAKVSYFSSKTLQTNNALGIGTSGFAIAIPNRFETKKTHSFSLAVTQTANFNNTIAYQAFNKVSSYAEQFAEEFVASKVSINDALNTTSAYPFTVAPALFTYLIDTVRVNGNLIVKAAPEYVLQNGQALKQEMLKTTSGGMYEVGAAYAGNDGNKLLWGLAFGVPIINFESNTRFTETDTSSNVYNNFKSFTYQDNYTTKGVGFNVKVGLIYRPKEYIRLGLAVHTPTAMALTDSRQASLKTELENPVGIYQTTSDVFTNNQRGQAKYAQSMPWKVMVSGSYVFREIEDVTKQRGFVTADLEYVKHSSTRFGSDAEEATPDELAYYKQLNGVVKDIYKGSINARLGGEVKFNTIMGRLGVGYYGNPYKDAPVKANRVNLSAGLGYRNKGFFADLTYVYRISRDFDVPYRLQNEDVLYADIRQNNSNVLATVGLKF